MSADVDTLIQACYAAAVEPDQWPKLLDQVGAAVGAMGLVVMNISRPTDIIASENLAEANSAYAAGWWQFDTRNARGRAAGLSPGTLVFDGDLIAPGEKQRDPFFQDFCRPHSLGEFAGYIVSDPLRGNLSISAFRDDRDGTYENDEVELLRRLAPHIAQAYTLTTFLAEARINARDVEAALGRVQIGVIALDSKARVRRLNQAAESLLRGRLRLDANQSLRTIVSSEQDKLDYAVASGLKIDPIASAGSVLLRGADGYRPIAIDVVPLRGSGADLILGQIQQSGALMLLRDLLMPATQPIEPQLRQLGLTLAEARIAMLVGRGSSPDEAAAKLAISRHTARTQLKSVFAKLGICRQSELSYITARIDVMYGVG